MQNYIVSCCSTVDLSAERMKELDMPVLSYQYTLDGKLYKDDFGQSFSMLDFYQKIKEGADARTAAINVAEYEAFFRKLLNTGKDLLHIAMSSGISSSYQAAVIAAHTVQEEYPDRKLEVIDSLCVSTGYGLLIEEVSDRVREGMNMDMLKGWILDNRRKVNHWFFSTDLTFYVKGGRISKLSGVVGGIFEICPLMEVDGEGKLVPRARVRTKKKVMEEIVCRMEENAENRLEYKGKVLLGHSACLGDCNIVKNKIKDKFKKIQSLSVYDIGTTVGSHTGPGTVSLFFMGKERE